MKLSIHSIYSATEGEGVFVGTPQVFVRFQGCSVGCVNCDSRETWEFQAPNIKIEDAMKQVQAFQLPRVSITGGDPLHPKNSEAVLGLVGELKKQNYRTHIEASGTRIEDQIFDLVDYISFDIKTPSTNVAYNPHLLKKFLQQYGVKSQIKAVIQSREDFDFVSKLYEINGQYENLCWCLTPAYNSDEVFPRERFMNVIEWNEKSGGRFRVIGQQHKWIFGTGNLLV